jgi:hypothetical protein
MIRAATIVVGLLLFARAAYYLSPDERTFRASDR